jgi:hypothetical protein
LKGSGYLHDSQMAYFDRTLLGVERDWDAVAAEEEEAKVGQGLYDAERQKLNDLSGQAK